MFSQLNINKKSLLFPFKRYLRANNYNKINRLKVSDEVREAIYSKKPVVSLESTIITHGLPFPENLEMALSVENLIRSNGCVPATTAFIKGDAIVGCSKNEIEFLANSIPNVNKCSRRDIPVTMAQNLNGGTTISGTMILSNLAGIRVFATGGLGGVHKGGELTMDISADLEELGRTPVSVVCAGPKAILDIPRTMEYLETKGCTVATMCSPNIPGFYTTDSGVKSPYVVNNELEAAKIIKSGIDLNLKQGYLFCVPPPSDIALDDEYIKGVIEEAEIKAVELNIRGKELTPFLLSEIAKATDGLSVRCNVGFVKNNCGVACNISKELSNLESKSTYFQPIIKKNITNNIVIKSTPRPSSLVIGSVAIDTYCKMNAEGGNLKDSNPGAITNSIGGVAYNITLASTLACNRSSTTSTRLVACVGNDLSGKTVLHDLSQKGIDTKGLKIDDSSSNNTAQYVSFHDKGGELIIACADMKIATQIPIAHIESQILETMPKVVVTDANISTTTLSGIIALSKKNKEIGKPNFKLIFEPTSMEKAKKLACLPNINVYPDNDFYLITPTVDELKSIYNAFDMNDKFDVYKWFPILDSLEIDSVLKRTPSHILNHRIFQKLRKSGIFQMGVNLLPFFPRIVVKDGEHGIYVFSIIKNTDGESKADFSIKFNGGALIEYYDIPKDNKNPIQVKNVTGAGDTFLGVLLNEIVSKSQYMNTDIFEDPIQRKDSLMKAQKGAILSIEYEGTISEKLKLIK
ncbi:uncharacterized protein SCODWIG_01698 [Saccharomycodes ludwigii]|uniref:Carbohydrate kinase PfkB domain-containing protein n=1 Tax=Saccharomycodes ludwigii TaxID=36035 RepID=A0A376B5G9_9ASCO|nr:hypothetical protein SCDLUD_004379 [Saccharomycodes ludwigii]KAH3900060.1 hypothetical protein SCDLUD_004379 [Saccharomycodes ludwigii]SSD59937.1 uncharacterized protein SCODWIG_01698 [Saccharomycodes ludwigii]